MALVTDKVRWGLLSTAWINVAMVGPMQRSGRSRLAAVASRSLEKAEDYAAANRIPRAYGSYQELVEDPEIDAIYNPLPNTLHAEWTIRAARAGKHVMCEKPLVTTLEHLQAVEAATRELRGHYLRGVFVPPSSPDSNHQADHGRGTPGRGGTGDLLGCLLSAPGGPR